MPPAHFASRAWIGLTVDLVQFLPSIDGTRAAPFLSKELTERMLSPDPRGVGRHPRGGAFGMGWDNLERFPTGVMFEKDGAVLGTMTWIEPDPPRHRLCALLQPQRGQTTGP